MTVTQAYTVFFMCQIQKQQMVLNIYSFRKNVLFQLKKFDIFILHKTYVVALITYGSFRPDPEVIKLVFMLSSTSTCHKN